MKREDITIRGLAIKLDIPIATMYRYMNVERVLPALDMADKINKRTKGVVGFRDWLKR